jgi:hypothetical protein
MSDGTTAPGPSPSMSTAEAYELNLKLMYDQQCKRLEELDSLFDQQIIASKAAFDKLTSDAQSASNIALLNAVNNADLLAKQAIRHADLSAANELVEQEQEAESTTSDLAATLQSLQAAMEGIAAAMQAVAANMATGRPPANVTGAAPASGS